MRKESNEEHKKNLFSYPQEITLLALALFLGAMIVGSLIHANPTQNPPGGNVSLSASQWTTSSTAIYYNGGNVGIGTSNPTSTLTVAGAIKSTTGGFVFPDGSSQTAAVKKSLPLRFTRASVNYNDSNATKDAACASEFGSNYTAATGNDVASNDVNGGTGYSTPGSGRCVQYCERHHQFLLSEHGHIWG